MTAAVLETRNEQGTTSDPVTPAVFEEPANVYHAKARHYLSSHQLGDFRKCPALYHRKRMGLLPDRTGIAHACP